MFLWSALAHLIALTSPGPDTAIVLRQVSMHGRAEGIKAAIGIGFGIYTHCLLAINGISILVLSNDFYKLIISLIGGSYILYLGINMLLSTSDERGKRNNNISRNSFLNGLITNIFNIKAFLFFVSLFSIIIDNLDGIYFYIYPIYFAVMSSIWFIFLSFIVTTSKNKTFNVYSNKYISSVMSIVLCAIGLLILIRSIYEYF
jgi:threonine/homoserine/homoserine lactone efflux protein|tara:strand:- start:1214 stop:1819 length:606 start_codon:yes stop_codon:yes gene_type:complete